MNAQTHCLVFNRSRGCLKGVQLLDGSQSERGTQIHSAGSSTLIAGLLRQAQDDRGDINARAAQVQAGGRLTLQAGGDVNIQAGQNSQSFEEARQHSRSGWLSSQTTTTRSSASGSEAVGSSLGGDTVTIQSGLLRQAQDDRGDIRISGSSVIADQDLNLQAARNVHIEAAQNTQNRSDFNQTQKSGLFGTEGGIGFTIGKQQQSTDTQNTASSAAASTVGSVGGNVNIQAGQSYTQSGSDVLTPAGDIDVAAQDIAIVEARTRERKQTEQKFSQSGLTVAVTAPMLSAVQGMANTAQAMGHTGNSRMQALGAATLALQGRELAQQAGQLQGALAQGKNPAKAASVGISISLGASQSQSSTDTRSHQAQASSLQAGGSIHLVASGAGANSKLLIQGSEVKAGASVRLSADNQVNLLASQDSTEHDKRSKNSSASIGVGISFGAQTSMGVTVSASAGKGAGSGQDVSQNNSHIQAGQQILIQSGGDANLKGAVLAAHTVKAEVGGDLTIESLQDSSHYRESNKQVGGSVTFGPAPGASVSASKSRIHSDHASVAEQSAIRAGDGGFAVNVQGNTTLTGGAITSTDQAVQDGQNSFNSEGGLSLSDIQNTASYKAQARGVTVGVGASLGASGAGVGADKSRASSSTAAGISGVAGNKEARTGDAQVGIAPIFDKEKVKAEVGAQVAITTAFGQQTSKAIGRYGDQQLQDAADQKTRAAAEVDPVRRQALLEQANALEDHWREGGTHRVALHTLAAGLGGGAAGALGAASSQTLIPQLGEAINALEAPTEFKQALTQGLAMGMGAAVGGAAGAASAQNATSQNYLTPRENLRRNRAQAECRVNPSSDACTTAARLNVLDHSRDRDMARAAQACNSGSIPACQDLNRTLHQLSAQGQTELQQLAQELKPSCAPPKDCAHAANWVNNELKTLNQFSNQIWAANASGAVQQSIGPEAALAGGVVSAIRLSATGFGLGTGFDAAGQYWQHGSVRPEQSLVAGMTGAVGIASVASLPTALRFYGVPAAGAAVAGANTTFNNFFYGEDTNVWLAGGLGAVFGAVGPRVGARVESGLTQIITNAPRIPIAGSATIPLQNRLSNLPGHVGSTVSHTVSNLPSFIPLDNGRQPLGSQP